MNIPPQFERRILAAFGNAGQLWLDRLETTVARYTGQFGLRDLEPLDLPSYSWVAFCVRAAKPCVLKLSVPGTAAVTEVCALESFPSAVACRVVADDRGNGAVLLERLLPGTPLRRVEALEARLHAAAKVLAKLHGATDGTHADTRAPRSAVLASSSPPAAPVTAAGAFPRYFDQARRAYRKTEAWLAEANTAPDASAQISEMIRAGRRALQRLEAAAADTLRSDRLLHGDLHHDNILRSENGWKLIDPKGVLGPLCLEPARFILNQVEEAPDAESAAQFERMCQTFAAALGPSCTPASTKPSAAPSLEPVSPELVAVAAVLDATVSACWSIGEVGDGPEVTRAIVRALRISRWASARRTPVSFDR